MSDVDLIDMPDFSRFEHRTYRKPGKLNESFLQYNNMNRLNYS